MTLGLSPELWARIFHHVSDLRDLGSLACVCRSWRDELRSQRSNSLWREMWDSRSQYGRNSETLSLHASSSWRAQVAACKLLASPRAEVFRTKIPQHASTSNGVEPSERQYVGGWTGSSSVESLGKATCVHAFNHGPVLIGFENGLALHRSPQPLVADTKKVLRRPRVDRSTFSNARDSIDVERSSALGGILMFAKETTGEDVQIIAATTTRRVIAIDTDLSTPYAALTSEPDHLPSELTCEMPSLARARLNLRRVAGRRRRRLIRWKSLDNFEMTDGHLVSLMLPNDRRHAFAGFSNGTVRVVDVNTAQLVHVLSMRESPDIICASERWVIACNFGTRPCPTAWDRRDGRAIHRWERSSVGWEEVAQVVGVAPTSRQDCFGVWDGCKALRILDVRSGRFTRNIGMRGKVLQGTNRNAKDEAEYGAAAAQAGPCKMILSPDLRQAVVAASNRVMIVNVHTSSVLERAMAMRQLDDARRSLVAFSTDSRYVVTAESNPFGSLGSRFATRASDSRRAPRICVWDVETGEKIREIAGVGKSIVDISVANNVIAVVGASRNDDVELGTASGEALVIQFDI